MHGFLQNQCPPQPILLVDKHADELMHKEACLWEDPGETCEAGAVVGKEVKEQLLVLRVVDLFLRFPRCLIVSDVKERIEKLALSFVKVLGSIINLQIGCELL